jgi:hypothetical protein
MEENNMNAEEVKIAQDNFQKRKKRNKGNRIDNASLRAGSPMYFFCKYCDETTGVLPEGYMGTPRQVCTACQKLEELGAIPNNFR